MRIGRDLLEIAPDVIPGRGRNRVVIASGAKQSRVKRETGIASSLALLAMTLMVAARRLGYARYHMVGGSV